MSNNRKIFSFDVFDTCLTRLCGDPNNVFSIVADEIIKEIGGGEFETEYLREKFVVARVKYGYLNSLVEIYNQVGDCFPMPFEASQMANIEMDIERKLLRPVIKIRELVNEKRKHGRVVFISDMYLPSEYIKSILEDNGFFKDGDTIYVSNEMGARKYDGSLFRKIRQLERLRYCKWHHWGDNKRSDFIVPKLLGIRSHLVHNSYLEYENDWLKQISLHYPYPSMFAGLSRSIRLGSIASPDHAAFVCDIVAPMMVLWVTMVMNNAISMGVRRLFFCARDTYPEFHIAKLIKEKDSTHRYDSIDIHYLFISTKVLYQYDESITLKYLEQEGVASHLSDVAVVDSRSRGNSFRAINDILSNAGYNRVFGYLICLLPQRNDEKSLANYPIKALFSNDYTNANSVELGYLGVMTEQIFSLNNHYKTVGYSFHNCRWRPVLAKDLEVNSVRLHQNRKQQDKLLEEYTSAFVDCGLLNYSDRLYYSTFKPVMVEFSTLPHRVYLEYLHKVSILGRDLPFVQNCFRSRKEKSGRWLQGSLVWTFSRPITAIYLKLQSKAKVRRICNMIFRKLRFHNPSGF